jgi:AcrR family transcriptional regulator
MGPMPADVNPSRPYHAPQRAERAAVTRRAVVEAARALFTAQGYAATTVGQIAERAGVAVDTLYAAVGRKPLLLREVVETVISDEDGPVPAEQRGYVRAIRAAATAGEKIDLYAAALARTGPRAAPVFLALRDAAARDATCAALHTEITERRAANMRLFAADLRATGELRPDLSDDDVADIVWSMNAADYYALLVLRRGWTPERYGAFLADAWRRILLDAPVLSS